MSLSTAIAGVGLTVDVADDGRGTSPQSGLCNGGNGLAGLNHRLGEVGGRFTLSAPPRGTLEPDHTTADGAGRLSRRSGRRDPRKLHQENQGQSGCSHLYEEGTEAPRVTYGDRHRWS